MVENGKKLDSSFIACIDSAPWRINSMLVLEKVQHAATV
jgi:hypothetical protein